MRKIEAFITILVAISAIAYHPIAPFAVGWLLAIGLYQLFLKKRIITRVEVIDWRGEGRGRVYTEWLKDGEYAEASEQDGGRTLKVFLTDK